MADEIVIIVEPVITNYPVVVEEAVQTAFIVISEGVKGDPGDASSVTAESIGLGNVDNTSDANKPVSSATITALSGKVDKITGKWLSTEDYTTAEKERLAAALIAETDPVFLASEAANFEVGDKLKLDSVGVAGNDLSVQFNNAGVQYGVDAFQYDIISSAVKIGESVVILPDNPFAIQRNVDSYLQTNLRNSSDHVGASADHIITADDGDDSNYYADFGLCNSFYASEAWDAVGPHDGYLFVDGGSIALVTLTVGKKIFFAVAQADHEAHPTDIIAEITGTGFNVLTGFTLGIGGVSVFPAIDEDDFISNSAVHSATQQSTKAYVDAAIFAAGSYTDEQAQDATGALITAGTKTGIAVTYDDVNNKIDFDASHNHAGVYAPALGIDDNYVTDTEKTNLHAPGSDNQVIPDQLSDLTDDSTHRLVTDTEKGTWNGKSDLALGELSTNAYRGDYGKTAYDHSQVSHAPSNAEQNVNADWNSSSGDSQILNKPTIPTALADLSADSTHRVVTDAQISTWNAAGITTADVYAIACSVSMGGF